MQLIMYFKMVGTIFLTASIMFYELLHFYLKIEKSGKKKKYIGYALITNSHSYQR